MTRQSTGSISILPVLGIPEIVRGDLIGKTISAKFELKDFDVILVTQKIVSKAEGMMVKLDSEDPTSHKKKIIEAESKRILRERGELLITETHHGFICANAGVDMSNVEDGYVSLLPRDSDKSARRIRAQVKAVQNVDVAVIITDTFGRAWRRGLVDVAIGVAGLKPIDDLRGEEDANGRVLNVTEIAIADELAAASELVRIKSQNIPVAVIRGIDRRHFSNNVSIDELIRKPDEDLFR